MTCALNVERVKKEENENKKREDWVRKSPASQVLISSRVRNSKDHKVLISLQLRLPVVRIFYRHCQLQVHKEVLLKEKCPSLSSLWKKAQGRLLEIDWCLFGLWI